jgi:hypothetical protein
LSALRGSLLLSLDRSEGKGEGEQKQDREQDNSSGLGICGHQQPPGFIASSSSPAVFGSSVQGQTMLLRFIPSRLSNIAHFQNLSRDSHGERIQSGRPVLARCSKRIAQDRRTGWDVPPPLAFSRLPHRRAQEVPSDPVATKIHFTLGNCTSATP